MKEAIGSMPRFSREIAGSPVEAHGYLITPYARVRGVTGPLPNAARDEGSGGFGFADIKPARITVQDRSGEVREVKLVNMEGAVLAVLAVVGLVVFLVSLFVRRKST